MEDSTSKREVIHCQDRAWLNACYAFKKAYGVEEWHKLSKYKQKKLISILRDELNLEVVTLLPKDIRIRNSSP